MTPTRSRLTNRNLANIAELNAHLRQAQKQARADASYAEKQARQSNPATQTLASRLADTGMAVGSSAPLLVPPQAIRNPSSVFSSRPADTPAAVGEEVNLDSDSESDQQDNGSDEEAGSSSDSESVTADTDPDMTLAAIAQSLINLAEEEETLSDTDELDGPPDSAPATEQGESRYGIVDRPFRLDITEIFNFRETYWCTGIISQAEGGLEKEAEQCTDD